VQQEAMKAQYLNNCAAAGVAPQPMYGFGAPTVGVKPFPMAGHLHPSAMVRAPLSRSASYDNARATAVPARFAQTGLGINVNGAQTAWGGQPGYPMQAQAHPGFGFRPNVSQSVAAARGMKRSFGTKPQNETTENCKDMYLRITHTLWFPTLYSM